MVDVEVELAEVVLREALAVLKRDVGQLKYRWFVRVVHFAVSELIRSAGQYSYRSIHKGQYHFALTCACSDQALHIMYLLGFDEKLGRPDSLVLDDYKQNEAVLRAFYRLGLQDMMLCVEDPMRRTSIASLDDVPSVLAHFVYNMRLRVELLTINFSQHITPELCPHIQQALISVETCATRLRLFDSTDNSTAWKNLKQRITWFLSNLLCNDQERLGLQSQLEELCNRFGNVLSESLSHRLRTLLGFGQNMKAVLCITDGMNMVDLQAAEIYMRTTSDIPHDAFSPEFMDVTEQVRACMRQVIAEPYKDSPEEVVELVHRLSAWQVEHFLSHFRCEAFNVSDVFGLLRFRGMQSVAVDSADSFPSTGYQLAGHIDVRDESESSGGEEKMDISEKEFAAENTVVSNGGRDSYQNEESPINQLDGMQPCRLEPGTEHPMDNITAALVDSVGSSKEKEYETHSSGNALRVEREQNDRVAIVRPRIPCEGLVAGLSMEEWESQVASADSNKESIYKVREQLVAAIRGQKETVVSLQNEITTMKKSSTVVHTMDDTCGDKQRKLIVADMWIQKMEDWNAALDEAVCKVQPKTISNVINCEVLKNLLRRVIEGHSSGGICSVLTLVSSVTQLINEVDVYAVLSDMYS